MRQVRDELYKSSVIKHSKRRAKERYDLWIDTDVYQITKLIKSEMEVANPNPKHMIILYRETKYSEKFHLLVNWRNKYFWVVWNNDLKTIQTFLSTERLIERVSKFSNSVIGYLGVRGFIDIEPCALIDVFQVHPQPDTAINNVADSVPSENDHSGCCTLPDPNHNQLQQQ